MVNQNDALRLLAQAAAEERAALTAVAALQEAATLLEPRLSGDALDAAGEALATVAAKYAKRGAELRPLVAAFEAMQGNARDRAAALASARQSAAASGPRPAEPPAPEPPETAARGPDESATKATPSAQG